ncbi:hypothetical protein MRX96_026090 [Rhipicephalus microplus]
MGFCNCKQANALGCYSPVQLFPFLGLAGPMEVEEPHGGSNYRGATLRVVSALQWGICVASIRWCLTAANIVGWAGWVPHGSTTGRCIHGGGTVIACCGGDGGGGARRWVAGVFDLFRSFGKARWGCAPGTSLPRGVVGCDEVYGLKKTWTSASILSATNSTSSGL